MVKIVLCIKSTHCTCVNSYSELLVCELGPAWAREFTCAVCIVLQLENCNWQIWGLNIFKACLSVGHLTIVSLATFYLPATM